MRIQRTATQHQTLQATAGVQAEDYADFRPNQRVMTADGYPGRVQAVSDGPYPGSEAYAVVLDGGMGGGTYTASQLRALADEAHTAASDYPELEDILTQRPDPAKQLVTAKKRTAVTRSGREAKETRDHLDEGMRARGHDMAWTGVDLNTKGKSGHYIGECKNCGHTAVAGDTWSSSRSHATCDARHSTCEGPGSKWKTDMVDELMNKRMGDAVSQFGQGVKDEQDRAWLRDQGIEAAKRATTQNGTRIDGHGEAPHRVRATDPNSYDAESTEGDADPKMYTPLTKKDEQGAKGGELAKGPGGVHFEGAMSPAATDKIKEREDARQDVVDAHQNLQNARRDRTTAEDVIEREDPAYARFLDRQSALLVRADWNDPEHGADWTRGDPFSAYENDGRWHDPLHGHDDSRWSDPEHGVDHTQDEEAAPTSHAAHLHLPEPEDNTDELVSHMVDAHGYDPDTVREMMAIHRGLHGQHEMDHETEPGGMGLHPDDFSMPHDHPAKWYEHGSIPVPNGVEQAGATGDPGHAVDNNREFEIKPWHREMFSTSARDPYTLVSLAARDRDLAFQLTAAWADVRNKAKRIRSEGKVRITLASDGLVVGEVQGDHHTYETGIQRLPGSRQAVATWSCGCKWGAYHWGADDDFSRFAGRMCSHALALQFEAQSRGMFGKTVEVDTSRPDWVPPRVVVKYNPDTGHSDFARSSSLKTPELSPLQVFCAYAGNDGETAEQIRCLLSTAGLIEGAVSSPWGEPIAEVPPKPYGATQPPNPWESPASAGFLSTPDPEGWDALDPTGQLVSRASLDEALFEPTVANAGPYEDPASPADPEGLEATLHPTPEPALPETDGGREDMVGEHAEDLTPDDLSMQTVGNQMGGADEILDEANGGDEDVQSIVARFQASAAGRAVMGGSGAPSGPAAREGASGAPSESDIAAHARQVLALKAFSPAEQQALIHESPGKQASNADRLDITGTHYADLPDDEDDATWLI